MSQPGKFSVVLVSWSKSHANRERPVLKRVRGSPAQAVRILSLTHTHTHTHSHIARAVGRGSVD